MNRRHAETADHDRSVKIKLTTKHEIRSRQLVLVSLQQQSGTRREQVASEGALEKHRGRLPIRSS